MKVKIKPYVFPMLFIFFCVCNIEAVILGMQKALSICANSIIPPLYMFMVLADMTISLLLSDNTLTLSPKAMIFGLGSLCGFPIGATVCERLYKNGTINERDVKKLLPFCNNASPAFVIGAIGISMLGDKKVGMLLYFSQLITSFIPTCFIQCSNHKAVLIDKKTPPSEVFFSAIERSLYSIFKVCAIICLFTAMLSVVENTKLSLLAPILEISCGSSLAASLYSSNPQLAIIICGFCMGFSGMCVHMQVFSAAKSIKVNYISFLCIKTIQGIISAAISLLGYEMFFLS